MQWERGVLRVETSGAVCAGDSQEHGEDARDGAIGGGEGGKREREKKGKEKNKTKQNHLKNKNTPKLPKTK